MSYAALAGLPSVYGLYGAFVPVLCYAALGSSRHLVIVAPFETTVLTGQVLLVIPVLNDCKCFDLCQIPPEKVLSTHIRIFPDETEKRQTALSTLVLALSCTHLQRVFVWCCQGAAAAVGLIWHVPLSLQDRMPLRCLCLSCRQSVQ